MVRSLAQVTAEIRQQTTTPSFAETTHSLLLRANTIILCENMQSFMIYRREILKDILHSPLACLVQNAHTKHGGWVYGATGAVR